MKISSNGKRSLKCKFVVTGAWAESGFPMFCNLIVLNSFDSLERVVMPNVIFRVLRVQNN